jgi:hypothetical protein
MLSSGFSADFIKQKGEKMKRYVLLGLIIFLPLCWNEISAHTFRPKSTGEILEKTVVIAVVQIVEGRLVTVDYKDESKDCGFIYVANVEDNLLGDKGSIEFFAERSLQIGRDYVIFLTEGDTAGQYMTSVHSMMWPAIKESMEIRELCEASYSGLKAIRGLTSEFKSTRRVLSDGEEIDERWIEPTEFVSNINDIFVSDKNDIAIYEFEAVTIEIHAPEKEDVTLSADELVDASMYAESSVYPFVWFYENLMNWNDYRGAVIAELADFRDSAKDKATDAQ